MSNMKNGFVALVKSQAETGREVIGTIAKVIPDNERFQIKAIDNEAGTITLEQVLPEGSEDEPKVITITESNQVVAHYVCNPNERPAPEAEIQEENGKKFLVLDPGSTNEKAVFMGSIKGLKVLGGLEGQVVFTVEGTDETNVGLMGYDVQLDKFYDINADEPFDKGIFFVSIDKDHTYVVENLIAEKPVLDKDGNETKDENGDVVTEPVFVAANLFRLYAARNENSVRIFISGGDCGCGYDEEYDEDDEDYNDDSYESDPTFGAPIKSVRLVEQAGRRDVVVVTESLKGNLRLSLYIDEDGNLGRRVGSFTINDADAKVFLGGSSEKPPVVTVKDKDQILIRTGRGLLAVDDAEVIDALQGYNYFAGVFGSKDDEDRNVSTWHYANADYDVKSFSSVVTDRGVMFWLED